MQSFAYAHLGLTLTACVEFEQNSPPSRPELPEVLVVGTLSSPSSYQIRGQGPVGFDYELAQEFGDYLQRRVKVTPYSSMETLFQAMDAGEVDLMAAALTRTPLRQQFWHFGPPLYDVTPKLIYRHDRPKPVDLGDVTLSLVVVKGSSHAELLHQAKSLDYPNLEWGETVEYDSDELAAMVAQGQLDYTLIDSTHLALNQRYHPTLRAAFDVGPPLPVAWALPKQRHDPLFSALLDFWDSEVKSGRLKRLEEKYFGHVQRFDFVDTRAFIRAVATELPRYQALFQQYAGELDWRKLAAVSYQESHWDPNARSPTGVRGLMMLTQSTAKRMGISNRLDPEQSIRGGSAYLQQLITRLPPNIPEDEAMWFALAAYNIGLGHLEDARVITQRHGKDPNNWGDVKQHLPLLRQRKHYERTKYGFARGDEAAHYVANIRRYYDTLLWLDQQISPAEETAGTATVGDTDLSP
ncbi:membrane-bound lytic murein transglycosylase MltF [Ferrimonas pelagia]|uniref:membrane-bound lytic murein transglycosylase MltF n=1 Tax=Ferrimonas pelagia TaxID=1177826 RepID=UPI0031F0500C